MSLLDKFRSLFGTPAKRASNAPKPAPAPKVAVQAAAEERRKRVRHAARKGLKVLVIDDSVTVCAVMKKMLRSAGFEVEQALDAESGLALAQTLRPHLIFLDIVLPGMNGFSALRKLRRDPNLREVPVIMISGNEMATEQFFAEAIGADDFMKKPFDRFEVFARIEGLLDDQDIPRRTTPLTVLAPL